MHQRTRIENVHGLTTAEFRLASAVFRGRYEQIQSLVLEGRGVVRKRGLFEVLRIAEERGDGEATKILMMHPLFRRL